MPERHISSRRDFLRGKAAAQAVADAATAIGEQLLDDSSYVVRVGRRAMACEFEVLLNAGQYPQGAETAIAVLDLVDRLEAQLSVFRDDSEVSRINQTAADGPVTVEPRLFALLERAAEIHRKTQEAYDIATGALTKSWGFYRRAGRMPDETDLAAAMRCTGMHHVELDPQRRTIQFRIDGVELNLGSIGKGYALDRMAEQLIASGVEDFLLHGGNSSVLGRGKCQDSGAKVQGLESGGSVAELGWSVGLRHPLFSERRIGEIRLRNRALGTSGGGTQFFEHKGKRYGHILDPRSGRPAEAALSATVAAECGAEADALATAFYVLGADAAIEYCRRHSAISAVVMSPTGDTGGVEIAAWGFSDDETLFYPDDSLVIRRLEI